MKKKEEKILEEIKKENVVKNLVSTKNLIMVLAIMLVLIFMAISVSFKFNKTEITADLLRARNYDEFEEGDEDVENTDNVKFSVFFLRDLDLDGYAEKIKGTCNLLGGQDTLYIELNVQTAGYLKDGKIEINSKNFYLQTALPKDLVLKNNYIGNNVKTLDLNTIDNGTQKLMTGIVRSGDYSYSSGKYAAIAGDYNKYSVEDNSVILTGIYVNENGEEIEIRKEVPIIVDWYGEVNATIGQVNQNYKGLENRINEEEGTLTLNFNVVTSETKNILVHTRNHIEGVIPLLNGYAPTSVEILNTLSDYFTFDYNQETRKFVIEKISNIDEDGKIISKISSNNTYNFKVVYPIDAYYAIGEERVEIKIPVSTYYEALNNPNEEFDNPLQSNIASATLRVVVEPTPIYIPPTEVENQNSFSLLIGTSVYKPYSRQMISKEKVLRLFNDVSEEEKNDTYIVRWQIYTNKTDGTQSVVMKERKDGETLVSDTIINSDGTEIDMTNFVSNKGIYFSGINTAFGEDGYVKIYNDETDTLIETFDINNWDEYNSSNPYIFENLVKHIRVETSNIVKASTFNVYSIKEIDDEYVFENYTKEQFDNMTHIVTHFNGYINGELKTNTNERAEYEAPSSYALLSISKNVLSTQITEGNEEIRIDAHYYAGNNNVGWKDGSFLVKFPEGVLSVEIDDITINNKNVEIETYEIIEIDGCKYIKINTKNIVEEGQKFTITIDSRISPDPRIETVKRNIELYAANSDFSDYFYKAQDIYDVNSNLNTDEQVNYSKVAINLVAPNSLLTNQIASEYDDANTVVISPQIADVTPIYANVDDRLKTAKVGIQIRNNYNLTISEVRILGKIPFEGNTTVLEGVDLGSEYTTTMHASGIEIPENLVGKVSVYYSDNENPTVDLSNTENNWKTIEQVEDFKTIKSFLIDLNEERLDSKTEYIFNYKIEIPNGLEFNKVAYSHHGIYFCLDTEQGKYKTQTEPTKLGFRKADKFNLEVIKTQKGKDKVIPGVLYKVDELNVNDEVVNTKTAVTDENGLFRIDQLYVEKVYEIVELKAPTDYVINEEPVRFIPHMDDNGNLSIEVLSGEVNGELNIIRVEGEKQTARFSLEDEAKLRLKLIKKEAGTETLLKGIRFKITGNDLPASGNILTTNANGEVVIGGLNIGVDYTLEEVKAEGYYLLDNIKFRVNNNEGTYEVEVLSGTVKETSVSEEDNIPTANITLENNKIERFTLDITKIKKKSTVEVNNNENSEENGTEPENPDDAINPIDDMSAGGVIIEEEMVYLEGAQFVLYRNGIEVGTYVSDENGKIIISDLYLYNATEGVKQDYVLKEILAPEGYSRIGDIKFCVEKKNEVLIFNQVIESGKEKLPYNVVDNTIRIVIEDMPTFKLIKKDAETGETLSGVKFALYNINDVNNPIIAVDNNGEIVGTKEIINDEEMYVIETDDNGEIILELSQGHYKIVEVVADEKYDIENKEYYFGIGANRLAEKILYDDIYTFTMNRSGNYLDYENSFNEMYLSSTGGYIVAGDFASQYINAESGQSVNVQPRYKDAIILNASDSENKAIWSVSFGGNRNDSISTIKETVDGGFIVGGYFESTSITFNNGIVISNANTNYSKDAFVVKYNVNREVEWAKSIGSTKNEEVTDIIQTQNGEYIAIGKFTSDEISIGEDRLVKNTADTTYNDNMIFKLDADGNFVWAKSITGDKDDQILKIHQTKTNGFAIAGNFNSRELKLTNDITINNVSTSDTGYDSIVARFDEDGNIEWYDIISGVLNENVVDVVVSKDDHVTVVGTYNGEYLRLSDGEIFVNKSTNKNDTDAFVVNYDNLGNISWISEISGDLIEETYTIEETFEDKIMINGGSTSFQKGVNFNDKAKIIGTNTGLVKVGIVCKYELDGTIIIGDGFGFTHNHVIEDYENRFVCITNRTGRVQGSDGIVLDLGSRAKGLMIRFFEKRVDNFEIPSVQELVVENVRKEFTITTEVEAIDGVKGGTITGEGEDAFEVIKYGDSSTKDIVISPKDNTYEIMSVTINGEEHVFRINEDGTYTLPKFDNVIENKHIVVKFSLKENKLVVNKVDSETKEPIEGAKFKVDQIEEREEPVGVIGEITDNGQIYYELDNAIVRNETKGVIVDNGMIYNNFPDTLNPISSVIGTMTNNGTYYFTASGNTYIPNNSGISDSTAHSYMKIDLSNYTGSYIVSVNATVSSESNYDFGFARVTENTTALAHNDTTGRFMYISGTVAASNYNSSVLEGGKVYYLHLGYRKDGSANNGNDRVTINSVNVYPTLDGKQFNFNEINGKYVSSNKNAANTVANSYIPIDLTNYTGKFAIRVNASISSQSGNDIGYVTLNTSTTRPAYNSSSGRFVYISGTVNNQNYISALVDGGRVYYLHLGYYKNGSTNTGTDTFTVNSVDVLESIPTTYNFVNIDNKYETVTMTNNSRIANSYIPIDLTGKTGKYNVIVNAEISSQINGDYGYVTVTTNTTRPAYNSVSGRFVYISGEVEAKEYVTVLDGGKMYYLHFGYYKNGNTVSGKDKFIINDVRISLNDSELYHCEIASNSQGQAMAQIPFGKYSIKEIEAPTGYELNENELLIEFNPDENHIFTVENNRLAKLIVHHYKVDYKNGEPIYTEEKLVDDVLIEGKVGDEYTTSPYLDMQEYELIKDSNGEYILPNNATGTLVPGEQEVSYYYSKKMIPLMVYHHIEGTEENVPLKDNTLARDIETYGGEGEGYTTNPISEDLLHEKYELVEIPENANGTYEYTDVVVTYYYRVKSFNIDTAVEKHSEVLVTGDIVEIAGGTILGENEEVYEIVKYGESTTKDIIAYPDIGYYVEKVTVNGEEIEFTTNEDGSVIINKFDNATEDKSVRVLFSKIQGKVTVHHFVEGTTEQVDSKVKGEKVQDEIKQGDLGAIFATKESDNVAEYYQFLYSTEPTSGEFTEENQEVIYYYGLKDYNYKVEYYFGEVLEEEMTDVFTATWGDTITEVNTTKEKYGYEFSSVENLPLIVTENEETNVIKVKYDPKPTSLIVKYVDKHTDEILHEEKVVQGRMFEMHDLNEDIIEIENYMLYENPEPNMVMFVEEIKEYIIYYAAKTKVTVNYIDKMDNSILETIEIPGKVGDEYTVFAKDFENYLLDTKPENEIGTMTKEEIVLNYHYVYISEGVVEKHIDINTKELLDYAYYTGMEGDPYKTEEKEFNNYDIVTNKQLYNEFIEELLTEEEVNSLIEKYEVETKEELFDKFRKEIVLDTLVNKNISSETKYIPENKEGFMTKEPIVVKYYYIEKACVKVEYIDSLTGKTIKEKQEVDENNDGIVDYVTENEITTIYNGYVGDEYEIAPKIIDGYILVQDEEGKDILPENAKGKMTKEEIIVKYYYVKSAKVIERHIDSVTNECLEPEKVYEGYVGKEYDIKAKEFDGFVLVESKLPTNAKGEMTEAEIIVEYYYIHKAKVTVEYIDKITGKKIPEVIFIDVDGDGFADIPEERDSTVVFEGYEGDKYKTVQKEFVNYVIVPEMKPSKTEGTMTKEEIIIKYYYVHKSAGVVEEHIDISNNRLIEDSIYHIGFEGDKYKITSKNFDKYVLVTDKLPNNSEGTMTKEKITVRYYYARKAEVIVRYVDSKTNEAVSTEDKLTGRDGDLYKTVPKDIPGYYVSLIPGNSESAMDADYLTIVTFYYEKTPTQVNTENKPVENVDKVIISNTVTNNKPSNVVVNKDYGKDYSVVTPGTGDNTPIIIITILGITVVANIIYFINRKKKSKKDSNEEVKKDTK